MNWGKMKLIIYAENRTEMEKKLTLSIQDKLPKIQIDTITSINDLSRILGRPLSRIAVMVIFVTCQKEIDQWLGLKSLFDNIRLILVLPDRTKGMVTSGLQLHPSFISYSDSDYLDITSVLKKMYQRTKAVMEWQGDTTIDGD